MNIIIMMTLFSFESLISTPYLSSQRTNTCPLKKRRRNEQPIYEERAYVSDEETTPSKWRPPEKYGIRNKDNYDNDSSECRDMHSTAARMVLPIIPIEQYHSPVR
ncbi:hypothetical protein PMAYCL1PPCAC_05660, partial [Pristionchus mayeri]